MYVSEQACSSVSYFNLLPPSPPPRPALHFPVQPFSLRKGVRPFCLSEALVRTSNRPLEKTLLPKDGNAPSCHPSLWPCWWTCLLQNLSSPREPEAGTETTHGIPGDRAAGSHQLTRPGVCSTRAIIDENGKPAHWRARGRQSTVPIEELFATYFSLWSFISQFLAQPPPRRCLVHSRYFPDKLSPLLLGDPISLWFAPSQLHLGEKTVPMQNSCYSCLFKMWALSHSFSCLCTQIRDEVLWLYLWIPRAGH